MEWLLLAPLIKIPRPLNADKAYAAAQSGPSAATTGFAPFQLLVLLNLIRNFDRTSRGRSLAAFAQLRKEAGNMTHLPERCNFII
jgi:hypothetical protein